MASVAYRGVSNLLPMCSLVVFLCFVSFRSVDIRARWVYGPGYRSGSDLSADRTFAVLAPTPENIGLVGGGNADTKSTPSTTKNPDADTGHTNRVPTILLWNVKPQFELGTSTFTDTNCSVVCNITYDRRLLPTAEVVIVNPFNKPSPEVPVPARHSQRQLFVFYLMENPYRSYNRLLSAPYDDLFNLTMTYLDDPATDLYNPYGRVDRRPATVELRDIPENRTREVAWLLSHCRVPSSRNKYASTLGEHVKVDIFGACGDPTACPKSSITCWDFLNQNYKFYLAFENGYCADYVTEKLFQTVVNSDLIPVVLGGTDYSALLPAKSYIDVRDFSSPKALAAHLRYLSSNSSAFREYLEWKKHYSVTPLKDIRNANLCKLCAMVSNNMTYAFKSGFRPAEYWEPGRCLVGEDEEKAVHLV